jgi:hypothetical protein
MTLGSLMRSDVGIVKGKVYKLNVESDCPVFVRISPPRLTISTR